MKKSIRKNSKAKLNILKKFYAFVEHHGSPSYRMLQKHFSTDELRLLGYEEIAVETRK